MNSKGGGGGRERERGLSLSRKPTLHEDQTKIDG